MPPKKKKEEVEDLGAMKAARFGRVKNDLAMGFVGELALWLVVHNYFCVCVEKHCCRFCLSSIVVFFFFL